MKKLLTKLEKRDIIDKHSNERALKQRVLEKAWNRLNSEKEGSRGYEEELKKPDGRNGGSTVTDWKKVQNSEKRNLKNFKKVLDKLEWMWYNK